MKPTNTQLKERQIENNSRFKSKSFFGKVAVKNEYNDRIDYTVKFNDTSDLLEYYNTVKNECYTTNFGLNPFESSCYGTFIVKEIEYTISNATVSNGDNNWWSYDNDSNKYCTITTQK